MKTFSWEGRCYEQRHGNRELANIYLATDQELDMDLPLLAAMDGFVELEDHCHRPNGEADDTIEMVTLVIEEDKVDKFLALLRQRRFMDV